MALLALSRRPRRTWLHAACRRWLPAGLATLLTVSIATAAPQRDSPAVPTSEYQLKAVFLFNFTQFVEWPPEAFADPDSPLVIGILGADPFGPYLDETVRGERIHGRPLVVRRFRSVAEVSACHILFVSPSETSRLPAILATLRGRPVLTAGDADDFAQRGGIVHFVTERSRIRLRVNLEAARGAHLVLSSKLLRAAEIIPPPGP